MALWGPNDREGSKPSWLTPEQKRQCFRTVRGWEIPLAGCGMSANQEALGGFSGGTNDTIQWLYRSNNYVGPTELLVAMPFDASPTGVSSSNFAGVLVNEARGSSAQDALGLSAASDLPNYRAYFTTPLTGDSIIVRGQGTTAYIPIIAADANFTDLPREYTFGFTASPSMTGLSLIAATGFTQGFFLGGASGYFQQSTTLTGAAATAGGLNVFGGWGGYTQGSAVLRVGATAVSGNYTCTLTVSDGRGGTGTVVFALQVTA